MMEYEIVADDLCFPEGPVWMLDGSVILVEVGAGRVSRVDPEGRKRIIATPGGGPNGAAIGPDGALYICNNGGMEIFEKDGLSFSNGQCVPGYETGSIQRIDVSTGSVETLYDRVDGRRLAGPNDIVFDGYGGFWFSDLGKHIGYTLEAGGIYYARADGTHIRRVVDGMGANGIGLSPDGRTLYAALTQERQVIAFDILSPGELRLGDFIPGRVLTSFPGRQIPDSLAVSQSGQVCVAILIEEAGIASVSPRNGDFEKFPFPDPMTTNICFGGADMRDAWITMSATGRLARVRWPEPGLRLAYYA